MLASRNLVIVKEAIMYRRSFLKTSLGGAASFTAFQTRAFATGSETPLRVGLIGSGWYGKNDLTNLMQVAAVEVVGLCDVDSKMLAEAADIITQRQQQKKSPATYRNYRQLLAEQRPEIVLIATPDHWHCLPMIEACQAGADVYVQKPISYDVIEGQAMVAAARKYKRTVQVGLQRRSTPHLIEARNRFIRSGKLGKIAAVDIHSYYGSSREFPHDSQPPENLDWQNYVGPAAWRNYNAGIHPLRWRDCREFSNGQTGDLCVHFFDLVRYFLDLGWPQQISANGGMLVRGEESRIKMHDTQTAIFDYGDLQVVWNQRNWGQNPDPDYPWGATLYGEKGTLKLSVQSYDFIPLGEGEREHRDFVDESEKFPEDANLKGMEVFAAPATRRHMENFLAARRDGEQPVADIREGHISTACCILANLSMELGRSLHWDEDTERVVDDEEANRRLMREYRGDWTHPTPENI